VKLIVDSSILESQEHRVLLVDPLNFSILDFIKYIGAIIIVLGQRFILELVMLHIDNLFEVENVINSLKDVSHQLLLVLYLNRCVGHQEWIRRYGHRDSLHLPTVALIVLVIVVIIIVIPLILVFLGGSSDRCRVSDTV